jgi:hypothetical protein
MAGLLFGSQLAVLHGSVEPIVSCMYFLAAAGAVAGALAGAFGRLIEDSNPFTRDPWARAATEDEPAKVGGRRLAVTLVEAVRARRRMLAERDLHHPSNHSVPSRN